MYKERNIIFEEVQKFRQWWLLLILILPFLLAIGVIGYGIMKQLLLGEPRDMMLLILDAVIIAICVLIFWLFYTAKLTTQVWSDGLYIRFFPFHLSFRRIPVEKLERYEVRRYSPITEYGGWGIRFGSSGKAYNVSGNRGVQLELSDGRKLLIGSQKPEELFKAIDFVWKKHHD